MKPKQVVGIIACCVLLSAIGWLVGGVDGFNVVGTIASIAGFGVSTYVAIAVEDIRRRYISHAMVANGLQRLEAHLNNLKLGMKKKDKDKVHQSLSACKGLLDGLRDHVPTAFDISIVVANLDELASMDTDQVDAKLKACEHKLNVLVERIRTHMMELQWGGRDG